MNFFKTSKETINAELADGAILPLLIRLTIPAALAQLVNALYSIVDRMYIGHIPNVGTDALSGIGLTFPITTLVMAFSCFAGNGGAPRASIAIGKGDLKEAQKYLNNAVTLLLFISLVLTASCLLFLEPILILFGADQSTLPYAYQYLQIYLMGTVFVELSMGLNPFINAQGFTGIGTVSVVIGALLNIILDPVFIYVFDMGIRGAALATVISQFVSCIWILAFLCGKKTNIRLCLKDMRPDFSVIGKTCALGVSPFTFRINESLVMILLNRLILQYGGALANLHLAAFAIVNSIGQIFFMPLIGVVTGVQPILSYNFGARNYSRIREAVHYSRFLSMGCALVMWFFICFTPELLCRLFTTDAELIALTSKAMRLMFCTVFMLGFQMVNQNAFVAMGNVGYSFLFGIMRKLLILVPLALLLPHFFGVWGIYAAEMISNPLTTVITFVVFERYLAKVKAEFSLSQNHKADTP